MDAPAEQQPPEGQKDGPLAEYAALRAESLQCSQQMSALFSLLIAANGVIIGLALRSSTGAGREPDQTGQLLVLLVLPIISYLIAIRYTYLYLGTLRIGAYIDRMLARKIPGGIGWERSLHDAKLRLPRISQTLPDIVAFLGTSIVGLIGGGIAIELSQQPSPWWALWLMCLVLTAMTARAVRVRHKARLAFAMSTWHGPRSPQPESGVQLPGADA